MKKIHKIFLSLLITSLVCGNITGYSEKIDETVSEDVINFEERIASAEQAGHKYAYMKLEGTNAKTEHMSASINSFSFTQQDGKTGLLRATNNNNSNIFLGIDDNYWFDEEPGRVAITIEYFDGDDASVGIIYPCAGWDTKRALEMILTEGSNKWKTKTYYLDDVVSVNETDVRLRAVAYSASSYGQKPIIIGNVFVEKDKAEHELDIKASNGYRGMIYDYGHSDSMKLSFHNSRSEQAKVSVKYSVYSNEGKLLYEEEKNDILVETDTEREAYTGVSECGTYSVKFNVKAEFASGEIEEYEKEQHFSIMRTFEKGDKRNQLVALSSHFDLLQYGGRVTAQMFKRIGISGWRGDANWNNAEVSQGNYVENEVQDACREMLSGDGIKAMLIAGNISHLYNGGRSDRWYVDTEAALNGYANYVKHIAAKEGVEYIEVINEFNHQGINQSKMSVEGYVHYCKAAFEAARAVNPDIKVVAGGLAGYDTAFIENFMKAGGLEYCDAISYHPYQYGAFSLSKFAGQTERTNELAIKYSGATKPIILSEMGWSTANDPVTNHIGSPENLRKNYLPQMLIHTQYKGGIEKIYYYCSVNMGVGPNDREHHFGLWDYPKSTDDCVATDTLVTLAAECKFFADAVPYKAIEKNNYETVAYSFKREGKKDIAALWTAKSNDVLTVDLGCDSVQIYDVYGNPGEIMKGEDGKFSFNLTDDVIYIEGSFNKFEESDERVISQDKTSISAILNDSFSFSITDLKNRNLKIRLDFDKAVFEADGQYDMINGKADIKVKVIGKETGLYHIKATAFDDDGIYYKADMPITIVSDMLDVKMQTFQVSDLDSSHWAVKLHLKNISNENEISGVCRIISPEKFKSKDRRFTELAPGETIILQLNLPELIIKRPEKLAVEIELSNGQKTVVEENLDFTTAKYADKKPKLDGREFPGEWNTALVGEDREERTYMTLSNAKWGGINDLSLKVKMMYDEDYLYMLCKVRDNIFCQEEREYNLWKADSVQIAILEDNTIGIEAAALAFTELAIAKNADGVVFYRHSSMAGQPIGLVENCEGAIVHSQGETIYEFKIPWIELLNSDHKAKKGDVYAFSMLVNDSDGMGRRGFIFYNDGIGVDKNPSKFGRLQLK